MIKLLAISIVAKSLLGSFNKSNTFKCDLFFLISSISTDVKEKKATSAHDIKADKTIKIKTIQKETKTSELKKLISNPEKTDNNKSGTSSKLNFYFN